MQTIHLESRMFLPFGRELEISDGCTNNSQSHQNIWWCGGNKCRTKRGHCKLRSKERHFGSLADRLWKITGHHCCSSYYLVYAVCKRGSLGNTWVLSCAKMMLVPMNFFSSGRICSGGFYVLTEQMCISFCSLFHTERSWQAYWFSAVYVFGRHNLPSNARAFSLTSFEM